MVTLLALLRRLRHGYTLGVRVIAVDGAGRILLVRHGYVAGWHLPGGAVDPGETLEAAARRELQEEANVTCAGPFRLLGMYFNPRVAGRDHVACFLAEDVTAGPAPAPSYEIREAGFFAPDALPPETTPATLRRVAEWRGGLPPAAHW